MPCTEYAELDSAGNRICRTRCTFSAAIRHVHNNHNKPSLWLASLIRTVGADGHQHEKTNGVVAHAGDCTGSTSENGALSCHRGCGILEPIVLLHAIKQLFAQISEQRLLGSMVAASVNPRWDNQVLLNESYCIPIY